MGEIAALGASLVWSFSSILFTLAGRQIGSESTNRIRLILAVLYLALAHLILYGEPAPIHAEPFRWGWLGVSGIVGLVLGDSSLFQAFVLIGPRRSMLLMTLAPVISALLAWIGLGETLRPIEWIAVLMTVGGIAWVVSENQAANGKNPGNRSQIVGVLFGLGGALGQAVGLVLSKEGLAGNFPSLSATVIRMVVAAFVIWLVTLLRGQAGKTLSALQNKRALALLAGGALVGPFSGVWLSMLAVQHAPVGLASTLMALSPIALIPLSHWIFHEKISPRSVTGTVIALAGAAIIFMT